MSGPESPAETTTPPTADEIRHAFDSREPLTIGAEEEVMLLDPESRDLAAVAKQVLDRCEGDPRFKLELPASQLEILCGPVSTAGELASQLDRARRDLAGRAAGLVDLAGAGAHPFAAVEGELNADPRYRATTQEYGANARRQLVFALQIHVAPGSADRALAVYNGLRSYLPEIAALAANAPFHAGADTGMASIRPQISGLLPRQGVPPPLQTWEEYAAALRWGARLGTVPNPGAWWWELRPHPRFGTLELRVPDTQTTVAEAAAVAAFAHTLVAWLGDRFDAGEVPPVHPSWRISENRWRAARDGVEGELGRLDDGTPIPVRESLDRLFGELAPLAERLGCVRELEGAAAQSRENGAVRQAGIGRAGGAPALVDWLCERFLA